MDGFRIKFPLVKNAPIFPRETRSDMLEKGMEKVTEIIGVRSDIFSSTHESV